MNRPETIEETAELVTDAGGRGIAAQVDHLVPEEAWALVNRIEDEQEMNGPQDSTRSADGSGL